MKNKRVFLVGHNKYQSQLTQIPIMASLPKVHQLLTYTSQLESSMSLPVPEQILKYINKVTGLPMRAGKGLLALDQCANAQGQTWASWMGSGYSAKTQYLTPDTGQDSTSKVLMPQLWPSVPGLRLLLLCSIWHTRPLQE